MFEEGIEAAAKVLLSVDKPAFGWSQITEDSRKEYRATARIAISAYLSALTPRPVVSPAEMARDRAIFRAVVVNGLTYRAAAKAFQIKQSRAQYIVVRYGRQNGLLGEKSANHHARLKEMREGLASGRISLPD